MGKKGQLISWTSSSLKQFFFQVDDFRDSKGSLLCRIPWKTCLKKYERCGQWTTTSSTISGIKSFFIAIYLKINKEQDW